MLISCNNIYKPCSLCFSCSQILQTDVCKGLAVTVTVIKNLGILLTEVRISRTHLVAICLPLDKRLGKLFVSPERKTCGPAVLTSQSAVVSCVLYNSSAEVKHLFVTPPCSVSFHLQCCFSPLRGHCSWILSSAYFVYLSTC